MMDSHKLLKLSILLFLAGPQLLRAQIWDSLGGGTNFQVKILYSDSLENYLYMAGRFYTVDHLPMKGIARWNGVTWDSLGTGIDGLDGNPMPQNTWCIERYQGKLYVGGAFSSLGDAEAKCIGTWDGSTWSDINPLPFNQGSTYAVMSMETINGDLYVGGHFDSITNLPCKSLAKWDGLNWTCLNFPTMLFTPYIQSICYYKNKIYVGGNFRSTIALPDTAQHILSYDGTSWRSVGGGIKGQISVVDHMVVFQDELYVSGYFENEEGNAGTCIQKWNDTTWSDVGGGVNAQVFKMIVHHNKLYAMGAFTTAGGIPAEYIAVWDGTNWCELGSDFDGNPGSACTFQDSLFIGGGFTMIDGITVNYVSQLLDETTGNCGNTTAIPDKEIETLISIYPNPVSSSFTIEFNSADQDAMLEIRNTLGQLISKETIRTPCKHEVNVGTLPQGVYVLSIKTKRGESWKKFVKN
jgi:hypothetical protein